jgi:hypothetical protein
MKIKGLFCNTFSGGLHFGPYIVLQGYQELSGRSIYSMDLPLGNRGILMSPIANILSWKSTKVSASHGLFNKLVLNEAN